MEKIKINIHTDDNILELEYPKYMFPKMETAEQIVPDLYKDRRSILHIMYNTYYPVRSFEGNLHFIKISISGRYDLEDVTQEKAREDVKKQMEMGILKFMLTNDYHKRKSEDIEKMNNPW